MKELNLTATAHALKARDEFEEKVDALPDDASDVERAAFLHVLDRLSRIVSESFADDTADRNARDVALLTVPGRRNALGGPSWLRHLLHKQGLYSGLE